MNRIQHNKTSLFLMELIISVLFFAVAGAICVKLFVSAHILTEKSIDVNHAVLWTQNISEVFQARKGNLHEVVDFYPDNSMVLVSYEDNPEIGTMVMLFDENWELIEYPSSEIANEDACYELLLCVSQLPASDVYSDSVERSDKLSGNALLGEIAVLRLVNTDFIDAIPTGMEDYILSHRFIDYYIGTHRGIPNES